VGDPCRHPRGMILPPRPSWPLSPGAAGYDSHNSSTAVDEWETGRSRVDARGVFGVRARHGGADRSTTVHAWPRRHRPWSAVIVGGSSRHRRGGQS